MSESTHLAPPETVCSVLVEWGGAQRWLPAALTRH